MHFWEAVCTTLRKMAWAIGHSAQRTIVLVKLLTVYSRPSSPTRGLSCTNVLLLKPPSVECKTAKTKVHAH